MYITILYKCILTQLQFAYILTKLQASDATGSYYQIRNLHLTAEVSAPPPDQLTNRLNFIRTVGGANRICTKIIIANTQEFDTNCVSLIDNIYNSSRKFAKAQSDTFGLYNDMFKIQIKYNDRSLFPRPLENQALLFNHLQAWCNIADEEWEDMVRQHTPRARPTQRGGERVHFRGWQVHGGQK